MSHTRASEASVSEGRTHGPLTCVHKGGGGVHKGRRCLPGFLFVAAPGAMRSPSFSLMNLSRFSLAPHSLPSFSPNTPPRFAVMFQTRARGFLARKNCRKMASERFVRMWDDWGRSYYWLDQVSQATSWEQPCKFMWKAVDKSIIKHIAPPRGPPGMEIVEQGSSVDYGGSWSYDEYGSQVEGSYEEGGDYEEGDYEEGDEFDEDEEYDEEEEEEEEEEEKM